MSKELTWKGASKYLRGALATTLIASIGTAYTYDVEAAPVDINNGTQVELFANNILSNNRFVDVRADHLFFNDIQWATGFDVSQGKLMVGLDKEKMVFGPDQALTEEQYATMIQRFYNVSNTSADGTVTNLNTWSDDVYASLASYGVPLAGYKDKSMRNKPITRGQMAQIVAHMVGQPNNLDSAVGYLMTSGISSGVKTGSGSKLEDYGYKQSLTRGQAAAFFNRLNSKGFTDLKVESRGSLEAGLKSGLSSVDSRLVGKQSQEPVKEEPKKSEINATNPVFKQVASIYEKSGYNVEVKSDQSDLYRIIVGHDQHSFIKGDSSRYSLKLSDTMNKESFSISAEVVSKLSGESKEKLSEGARIAYSSDKNQAKVGKVRIAFSPSGGVVFNWD